MEQLAQRARLRWLVHGKKSEARQQLVAYLQAFPVGTAEGDKFLRAMGLDEEKLRRLQQARAELMDMGRFAGNDVWFERFASKFQAVLDGWRMPASSIFFGALPYPQQYRPMPSSTRC